MAIFFDAPVEPDALTAFIREVPVGAGRRLLELMPPRYLDTNTVDFAEIVRTNRTAKFRAFDGRISVSSRDVGSEKRVSMIPLSTSLSMGEYERLQLEFARSGGTNQAALARSIYNDAENLTNEVLNRLELAWGDVLTDGKLTINENGYQGEADFGVPGTHIVTAATPWTTTATAPALTNLIAWHDVYVATNGAPAGGILTSQRVIRLMTRNTEIINNIRGAAATASSVSLRELNDLLADNGLPPLLPSLDENLDVDGSTTRVIADDKLMFVPLNIADLGYTAFGVSATSLELVNSNVADLSFEEAPGIVGVVEKVGPPYRQFTFVDAVAMPILANAKLLFVADVI